LFPAGAIDGDRVKTGGLTKTELAPGALAADATGRAIVAADFFNAATADDKFAADAIGEDLLTANELTARVIANIADLGIGIPFAIQAQTAAGATEKVVFNANAPFKVRVLQAFGTMTGAGAAGDTVKLTDGTNDVTNAVDVSAKGDKATFQFGEVDDARHDIAANGTLKVVTASDALCLVTIIGVRVA
jgi:hypothetical protein